MNYTTYTTDYKWRNLLSANDVPDSVLKDQFSWMEDPNEHTFFQYRGFWYCLADFLRTDSQFYKAAPIAVDGYNSDSAFSAVLIELSSDGDQYRVCTVTT